MRTRFSARQLADPALAAADAALRRCAHCGFCLPACPTYLLTGDESDSPRGRVYALRDLFESGRSAPPTLALHLDRCLSCLGCRSACPSGVDYRRLIDLGRERVEETYVRPPAERLLRRLLAAILPFPGRFRLALRTAPLARPFKALLPEPLARLLALAPARLPPEPPLAPGTYPAQGTRRKRVALLAGCVQQVLGTDVHAATIRLLNRIGVEVVVAPDAGCCGALAHHMGDTEAARAAARRNVAAWEGLGDLDAVLVNVSGCGSAIKDYGFLLHAEPEWAERGKRIAGLARDVCEYLDALGFAPERRVEGVRVAYHAACTLRHGQGVRDQPKALLKAAGFEVAEPAEAAICCGSAGTYSITQPALSSQLGDRKAASLEATGAQVVAAGNVGCIEHLRPRTKLPVVHTVQLLDWAAGGAPPPCCETLSQRG